MIGGRSPEAIRSIPAYWQKIWLAPSRIGFPCTEEFEVELPLYGRAHIIVPYIDKIEQFPFQRHPASHGSDQLFMRAMGSPGA
ncbi:hypothetical protein IX51_11115 [uncultured archaeon]|nr:hypothetical protein IX51_11115 [uncultured archaeon]